MAIRQINYTVTSGGIKPATLQAGGVQREHNATLLRFKIDDKLWEQLQRRKEAFEHSQLIYRVDGYDGLGVVHPSDVTVLDEQTVEYYLERCVTKYGGKVRVTLVITLYKNSASEMELCSYSADLQLKSHPGCSEHEEGETISALAYSAKESVKQAEAAAERAEYAKAQTEDVATNLEEGLEVVFLGGDAESGSKVLFKVDGTVIKGSPNPVSGGAVFDAIKVVDERIDGNNATLEEYADNAAKEVDEKLTAFTGGIATSVAYIKKSTIETSDVFVASGENAGAIGDNTWRSIIFDNGYFFAWGNFNIKPTPDEESGGSGIYLSQSVKVPLPFDVKVMCSSVTGNATNQADINNIIISADTVEFRYRRVNVAVAATATRTYLQAIGMVADINSFKEAESDE